MLPGLSESLPLLVFGAACLALSLYAFSTRGQMFGGRVPVWAYLLGLGAIAVVGGLISSAVGEDFDDLPKEGDRVGSDLVVVPLREWNAMRERAPSAGGAPSGRRSEPMPRAALPERTAFPGLTSHPQARAPTASPPPIPPGVLGFRNPAVYEETDDWWDDALQRTSANPEDPASWLPEPPSAPGEARDVLETLDSIQAEIVPASARTRIRPGSGAKESRPAPRASATPLAPLAGLEAELARFSRELDRLEVRPPSPIVPATLNRRLAAPPRPAAVASTCVSCDSPMRPRGSGTPCEACGRSLCGSCLAKSQRSDRPGLCPMCAMLLDGSELT
ncbi:MAG TPA: hypothetical protein VIZ68_03590 [Thermoplasmata archaeon]